MPLGSRTIGSRLIGSRVLSRSTVGGGAAGGTMYDFTTGVLPAGMTFTRASTAWYFGSGLTLVSAANDVPRFAYDPAGSGIRGLLVEGASTNSIRNNSMVGAVAGTPGTPPNFWTAIASINGLALQIVGVGVEDGIPYVDIRYFGTANATSSHTVAFDAFNFIAAVAGQIWSHSFYCRLIAGSAPRTLNSQIREVNAGGSTVQNSVYVFASTGAALKTQRFTGTRTLTDATCAFVGANLQFSYNLNDIVDFTYRIGAPQLEQREGPSSPILTTSAAVTRALDAPLITNPSALTDKAWIIKGHSASYAPASTQALCDVGDGTLANHVQCYRDNGNAVRLQAVVTSVSQGAINAGTLANDTDFGATFRYGVGDLAASLNGAAVVTGSATSLPPTLTQFQLGRRPAAGGDCFFSTLKSFETRPTMSNAQLQAASTP